jgi:hypothetical protein
VIALTGEQARKLFYNDNSLDISEGYRILQGGAPRIEDINISKDFEMKRQERIKRIHALFRKERVVESSCKFPLPLYICMVLSYLYIFEVLPNLLYDLNRRMLDWKKEGRMNPFNEVYDVRLSLAVITILRIS